MSEAEIIKGCLREEQGCQRLLFEKYAGKMLSLCQRYSVDQQEAKDFLQEGFIKVFEYIGQFRNEGSFEGWMRRVFVSVATRHISKRKINFSEISNNESEFASIDSHVMSKISQEEIHRLIAKLPEGYKLVFNLNIIEGYSHEEIATLLGIQATTSRTQLLKARKMLQAFITKQYIIPVL